MNLMVTELEDNEKAMLNTTHYVDNKRLLEEYKQWRTKADSLPVEEEPPLPKYIVDSMVSIAIRLSRRPNFVGYSWRTDMVSDAIESLVRYRKSFDAEKSLHIFGYFTTICFNSFVNRIKLENKQAYIKAKMIHQLPLHEFLTHGEDETQDLSTLEYLRDNNQFDVDAYEEKLKAKNKIKLIDEDEGDVNTLARFF